MIVTQHQGKRLLVNIYGEFSLADYQEFEDEVNSKIKQAGPLDLFLDLREMSSFTLDVAWEDLVFSRDHPNDFRRIAVLTESQWVTWIAWLQQIFTNANSQVFETEDDALNWLDTADTEGAEGAK